MRKIALDIVGLQPSMTQTHNYAVVLGERHGNRRLPIIIGGFEAQAIAVAVERMLPNRPLTHDLFKNALDTFGVDIQEVIISNLLDGVFYARLICLKDGVPYEIDSRTSDALAMAVRFSCPIYTYEFILEAAGVVLEESEKSADAPRTGGSKTGSGKSSGSSRSDTKGSLAHLSLDELNRMLNEVLQHEDYKQAAAIRDEMTRRKV
ncbi:MAG: bifunctional nuclease family protein [Saprospiraceae bacterium]|nr:bifunctional nuclease family protein [Saprospiraceae bacterium]